MPKLTALPAIALLCAVLPFSASAKNAQYNPQIHQAIETISEFNALNLAGARLNSGSFSQYAHLLENRDQVSSGDMLQVVKGYSISGVKSTGDSIVVSVKYQPIASINGDDCRLLQQSYVIDYRLTADGAQLLGVYAPPQVGLTEAANFFANEHPNSAGNRFLQEYISHNGI